MNWEYELHTLAAWIGAQPPAVNPVFHCVSTDTRSLEPGAVFFALSGARFDGNAFVGDAFARGASAAVAREPHSGGPCLITPDPLKALQSFAAQHRVRHRIPLIAITGSCGKTGTKELIAALLATRHKVAKTHGNLNNEIGAPLSLLAIDSETDIGVFELGANHHGEIARMTALARPTESAITLIAPAHLEGFGSVDDVARAKAEIVEGLPGNGVFYMNMDDPRCVAIGEAFPGEKVRFGSEGDVAIRACEFDNDGLMRLTIDPVGDLRLPLLCRAHASNVALAVAAGLRHGVTEFEAPLQKAVADALRFKRLEVGPLEVLDDTYNANPASVVAALRALAERPGNGKRIAALGDMLELGDEAELWHRRIGEEAANLGVDHLFVRGDFAWAVKAGAGETAGTQCAHIDSHDAMAGAIAELAEPGDVLLLKGSRGMQMEKVITALQNHYG